jgi:endonuclease/exonuclease/phosphatase family metal-dependent hydrolase
MRRAAWLLVLAVLGCAGRVEVPAAARPLTIATYNLWHGLDPVGTLKFREYETREGREARLQAFLAVIRKADPDLLFLEEVNPLPKCARRIAGELGMDEIHQVDNCGLRIGPVGVPVNLRSGLAILAKRDLRLRRLGGRKLTGPFGLCSDLLGVQFREFRYGLAGAISWNDRRVLVAGVHLHHGPEIDGPLTADLERLVARGAIDDAERDRVRATVAASDARRRTELETLFVFLDGLGARETPLILAGDLNLSPDSAEMGRLLARGLTGVTGPWDPATGLYTWDLERNPNTRFSLDFSLPYDITQPDVVRVLKYAATRTRRLDYVLYRDPANRLTARDARLIGNAPVAGVFPSDHFGLAATIEAR